MALSMYFWSSATTRDLIFHWSELGFHSSSTSLHSFSNITTLKRGSFGSGWIRCWSNGQSGLTWPRFLQEKHNIGRFFAPRKLFLSKTYGDVIAEIQQNNHMINWDNFSKVKERENCKNSGEIFCWMIFDNIRTAKIWDAIAKWSGQVNGFRWVFLIGYASMTIKNKFSWTQEPRQQKVQLWTINIKKQRELSCSSYDRIIRGNPTTLLYALMLNENLNRSLVHNSNFLTERMNLSKYERFFLSSLLLLSNFLPTEEGLDRPWFDGALSHFYA